MQLKDITKAVRNLLQDPEADADLIKQSANWFIYDLFNKTKTRLMEQSDFITIAKGATYAPFPADQMAWVSMYLVSPQVFPITDLYVDYSTFMARYANFSIASPSTVRQWTDFGRGMRLSNPTSVDHKIQVDYVREPVPMDTQSDDCEVPARYIELVSKGTLKRMMEVNEDYDIAQHEVVNITDLRASFVRNEARGGGKTRPTRINSRRRANGGASFGDPYGAY
jgi:hypothetical protein